MGREVIQVRAVLPPPPSDPDAPLPETGAETDRIAESLRRAIRLGGLAYATGQTCVQWCVRSTHCCLTRLKQSSQADGDHQTTMIDLQVMQRPGAGGPSPRDIA
ncbi:MAG: hypothetical protein NTW21_22850 [Verrucomicrobia bacterium]|nr:hypothetical protein [Verrucomicrobiota bacterium]